MKTLDIALSYARKLDISGIDIYYGDMKTMGSVLSDQLEDMKAAYLADPNNTQSNETWRLSNLETALLVHLDEKHRNPSLFDIATTIIEEHRYVLVTDYAKWKGTVYPDVMVKVWIAYLADVEPKPVYIKNPDSEIIIEFFFVMYHYIIG